ncbi:NADH dehydrogenase subunit 4L (mitochondrion) [Ylistrum balloti]|uniref:NADH dehydrogenase subunit 4L n=1 Tax=Ylistrum balloti TaxID=509963 RepID=UPI00226CD878|nr:NADH dehydrogenase subunit 4L [Ylistrum balloti]UZN43415.1 NADH dehydrogenase subunit 4L [Ylistrum balloti]
MGVTGVFSCTFFIGGWLAFGCQRTHILSALLCMEVVLVGVLGGFCSSLELNPGYFFFFVVGLGVCESALGLSLLVIYARSYGNDLFKGLDGQGC